MKPCPNEVQGKFFSLPFSFAWRRKILSFPFLSEEEVIKILDLRGMEKKTRRSIIDKKKFLREFEKVGHYGFAFDNEENNLNVRCLAALVFNANGETVAALGTSTTILQLDKMHLPKVVELVKDAAQKVSR